MQRLLVLFCCAAVALTAQAAKRVTLVQFEKVAESVHGKKDADAADRLSQFELTERMTPARTAKLRAAMPGPMSKDEVLVLADASSFSPLPADEELSDPAPDADQQHIMIDAAVQYASQVLAKLPNFFASRETILFMDTPPRPGDGAVPANQSLLLIAKANETVLYRGGKQVVEAADGKENKLGAANAGLIVSGEFGPILATVFADAKQGELVWSHWEQIDQLKIAVFRYSVAKDKSHYEAQFCCVTANSGQVVFKRLTAYHGEIALDPETGTIFRLSMQSDLKPAYPMSRADLQVEYGPVEIGGQTYNCPIKSIAIARGYEPAWRHRNGAPLNFSGMLASQDNADAVSDGPEVLQTMMNHAAFHDYHLFRSATRILTGDEPDAVPTTAPRPN